MTILVTKACRRISRVTTNRLTCPSERFDSERARVG